MEEKHRRIIGLRVQNYKGITLVDLAPDPHLNVIGGLNESGKSSFLDSIPTALLGARWSPSEPVRHGQHQGSSTLDLGDGVVVSWRKTEQGRATVTVTNKTGTTQDFLDSMVGSPLGYDASKFLNASPKEQKAQALKALGVDITDLEEQRTVAFEDRTNVNRDLKSEMARQEKMSFEESWPDAETDVVEVAGRLRKIDAAQMKKDRQREDRDEALEDIQETQSNLDDLRQQIGELEVELESHKMLADGFKWVAAQEADLQALGDQEELTQTLAQANEQNKLARSKAKYRESVGRSDKLEEESKSYTKALEWIEDQKVQRLATAKFPVKELSFDDTGLRFKGIPFEQASQSERCRVVIALAVAEKAELRLVLFRDASLFDEHNWKDLEAMCQEFDVQVFAEIVGDHDERITVLMEDGEGEKGRMVWNKKTKKMEWITGDAKDDDAPF